jgi:Sec-independent protein translocase protein TatA
VNPSDVEITAGLGGFLVLFGLALVLWFLGRDLSRRLRRMRQSEAEHHPQTEATTAETTTAVQDPPTTTAEQDPSTSTAEQERSTTDPPVSPPRP